jgi:large repetitive protein
MLKTKLSGLTIALFLLLVVILSPPVHATTLDVLAASGGTIQQGNLLFSNFAPNALTAAATVDVTGFTAAGVNGLRFTSSPAGTQFAQATAGGGGARELIVDVTFTVTVTDPSFLINAVSQSIDPTSLAVGNAIITSLTGIPAHAPITTLASCVDGTGVPGGVTCVAPLDSTALPINASTLDVDRQVQLLVGQKNGLTLTGSTSVGFFDVSFPEVSCPPLTAVAIAAAGSTAVCPGGIGGTATVTDTGGGAATSHQWGYRTTTGGIITDLAGQIGSTYAIAGSDFAGAGSYLLVCTTLPTCGGAVVSNEVPVTVTAGPAAPAISGPSSFCAGSSITLTSSSATGNLWSTGATTQSIAVSAGGSYSVTFTNAAGCTATSAPFAVTQNPLPVTPTISGPTAFCPGKSITLTSSSATGNLWSTGATTPSITVSAAGSFTVKVTDANGCSATSASFAVTASPAATTPTVSGTSSFCAGGSVTLTSSSATGNLWSTGATTQSITVTAAGSYSVTATNAAGCSATSAAFAVASNALPATPTISGPASFCAGGSVTLTSSSTAGNLWSTGATTQSIAVSTAGSYSVTVTNAAGCSATSAALGVTSNPLPATPVISGPASFCAGTSITLTSSSATGNLWSTGATTQSITVSASGSFTVKVTDANGCSATSAAFAVTALAAPATPTISGPASFCAGTSITLTSSSTTGNLWSTGATTQSITVSAAGSYSVTVTGANGCKATSAAFAVTSNPLPATPAISGPSSFCAGSTITLTSSSATGNLWSTGPTTQSITVSAAGSYSVTVTNAAGCKATSAAFAVTSNALPATPTITGPASFCPGTSITLTSSSATGNLWSTGATTQSITVTAAGSYTVKVTNAAGCSATSTAFAVTANPVPATPTISGPTSFCGGGTITLTSSSATGNLWSTGATTQSISIAAAGTFTVTVTNASGCSAISAPHAVTTSAAVPTPTISGPASFCPGSTITLTSSAIAGNLWSTGATTQSITVSAAGSYSVTVTDANGCSAASAAFAVTANPAPATPVISGAASFCPGSAITLTSSSATGNLWSTGATAQSITVSVAGSFTVTVTNASGCSATSAAFAVTANPAAATPTIGGPSSFCPGASITLTSSSATGNLWSTGATTQSITVSAAGSFTVTATNAGGCSATSAPFAVTANPAAATPTISGATSFCAGGSVALTSSSATGNLWSTGATTQSITVSAAGSYSVTVTNASGCQATSAPFAVTSNPAPAIPTITGPSSLSCAGGTITLTSSSATGNLWSTGATTQSIAISTAGTYTVTVTNASGCSATSAAFSVAAASAPATPTITGPTSLSCTGGSITLTSSSTTGNLWSTGATTQSIAVSTAGTYTVTVTNVAGCSATSAAFSVAAATGAVTPTITGPTTICPGKNITLTSSSTTGNLWSTGATTQSITVSAAGSFTVTVTSAGCSATSAPQIVTSLAAAATNDGPVCTGGTVQLTTPFVSGATYEWNGPNAFRSFLQSPAITNASAAAAGTYTLKVTTSTCSTQSSTVVSVTAAPSTPVISQTAGTNPSTAGASITLDAGVFTTYLWSTGATTRTITVSPSVTTTYTVTGANGACSSAAGSWTQTVSGGGVTPTISGPSSFCPGVPITLTSSSATGNTWSTGATTQSISVSTAGSYTVTVAGLISAAKAVTANPAQATPTITGGTSFCAGGTVTLTSSSATGNLWSTGATTQSIIVSVAGSYTVTVTNASGCQATSAAFAVTANPAVATTPTISGPASFCAGGSITLTSSSVTGNLWSTGAPTQSITVSAAGSYSVTATNAGGCQATSAPFVVTANALPVTPGISGATAFCAGGSTTLTSSSTAGNLWSTGATTQSITVSAAGSYSVTVTDASGCQATSAATVVSVNPLPATPVISGPTSLCGGATITLTSSSATGNLWSTGATTQSITVSAAGSYSVTVTDPSGCSATSAAFAVTLNPTPATPVISGPTSFCAGSTITLTSSSATGNLWSTGAITQSISVSAAGTYSVTVTNASGCSATSAGFAVTSNPLPATPVITGPAVICGAGTVTLSSSSATGNLWSTGATTQSISVSAAGAYSVTLTDASGCSATSAPFAVTVVALPPTPVISGVSSFCAGGSTTLTSSSTTGNLWSTGATTQSVTVSAAAAYSVTVTNASGCSATSIALNVTVNAAPATPVISGPGTFCPGTSITLTSSSATGNRWSTGATTQSIVVSTAGSYTVTVTNAGGCSATSAPQVVAALTTPVASNSGPGCPGSTIQLSATAIAGGVYSWSGPHGYTSSLQNPVLTSVTTNNTPGTYSVTVTVGSCTTATASTNVTVNATCP